MMTLAWHSRLRLIKLQEPLLNLLFSPAPTGSELARARWSYLKKAPTLSTPQPRV